jgi:hypothetical protein
MPRYIWVRMEVKRDLKHPHRGRLGNCKGQSQEPRTTAAVLPYNWLIYLRKNIMVGEHIKIGHNILKRPGSSLCTGDA